MASVFKRGGKTKKGGYYYASWFDHTRRRRSKCTKTTDKATAERIAAHHETEAAKRREGLIDVQAESFARAGRQSLEEHLTDYSAKLRAGNLSEKHVKYTLKFIRGIAAFADFSSAGDINADGVNRYARSLHDKGRAPRTVHAHLSAIKAFTRWLVEGGKLPRDPLSSVKKPNPKANRRRERRMLLPDEWNYLESATTDGLQRYGLSGYERALLYRVAIQTGLRANELRSLTVSSIVLAATKPFIQVKAGSTKNRKLAKQFIKADLASELREYVRIKTPTAKLFNLPHESNLARMLREDLAIARRLWLGECLRDLEAYIAREQTDFLAATNHDGQLLDFHSLRHSCGAWLASSGAHLKTVQSIMRHSTITLTMDTYGHLMPGVEVEAADKLGSMLSPLTVPPKTLRMTGTHDRLEPSFGAQRMAQQSGCESVRSGATRSDNSTTATAEAKTPKPALVADLGAIVPFVAMKCETSGGGTRTPDTRIMIPLL